MYVIQNTKTKQYYCAELVLGGFHANVEWSSDSNDAMEFKTREDAQEVLDADPFPSACKVQTI